MGILGTLRIVDVGLRRRVHLRLDAQVVIAGRDLGDHHRVVFFPFGPVSVAVAACAVAIVRHASVRTPEYLDAALLLFVIPLLSPQGWDYVLLVSTPAVMLLLDRLDARTLGALIAYGAVILAFLGAVHWGFALAATAEAETRHARTRLTLGVVPALIGWGALLLPPWAGLTVLICGFLVVWATEEGAAREGLVPTRYLWLRRLLTLAVVVILSATLMGVLIG